MVGYTNFHTDVTLNFMANRMTATISNEELAVFANGISDLDGWIEASFAAAVEAEAAGRDLEAGTYFRAAEFFMAPDHANKAEAYDRFLECYDRAHPEVASMRRRVPYGGSELEVIDVPATGPTKDVIVACSGFDGLIEEMYAGVLALAANGYRVVLYEGPGQGAALRRSHLPMIAEWERPVAAVLDHLEIESCTLLGLSLGGYLAPRAAAFEPRAKRIIAWGAHFAMIETFRPRIGDESLNGLIGLMDEEQVDVVNEVVLAMMETNATARWSITHGMHTCGGETPYDFIKWVQTMTLRDVADRITQDTLILHGASDHLVPVDEVWVQAAASVNAKSVTARIFSEYENAAEHCQVTNRKAVYDVILDWLEALQRRNRAEQQPSGGP